MKKSVRSFPFIRKAAALLALACVLASGDAAGAATIDIDLSTPDSGFTTTVGTWESGGGTIRQTAPAKGTWETQAAVYGARTFGDFVLEYKVKVGTAGWAGVAFRVPSKEGFGVDGGYTLIHGVSGTQLFDMKNKGLSALATGQGFVEGDYNVVRVVVAGTSFKVYVNELEQTNATYDKLDAFTEGYLALVAGNGTAEFKDIRIDDEVTAVPTEEPILEAPTRDPSIPTPTAEALFVGYAGDGIRLSPEDGKPEETAMDLPVLPLVAGGVGLVVLVFVVGAWLGSRRRRQSSGKGG